MRFLIHTAGTGLQLCVVGLNAQCGDVADGIALEFSDAEGRRVALPPGRWVVSAAALEEVIAWTKQESK